MQIGRLPDALVAPSTAYLGFNFLPVCSLEQIP